MKVKAILGTYRPSVMFLNAFSDCVKIEILNPDVLNLDNEGLFKSVPSHS